MNPEEQPLDPPPQPGPRVHVVDDDPSHLRSVARLLRAAGFHVSAYQSAQALLGELRPGDSGCVLTDLRMPDFDGLDLQDALRQAGHEIPIVFLSGQGDVPSSVRAMKGGAQDFLTKTAPKAELISALHAAIERDRLRREESARLEEKRRAFESLSPRELEVLRHVVRGQLNKQIAADLGIHERTVKLHRTSITTKLRVHSVAELTRLVRDAGME